MFLLGIAFVVGGIAIAGVGAKARSGWYSRQSLAGIRTWATLASDETWRAAHRAGSGWVIAGGAIMAVGGILTVLSNAADTAIMLVTIVAAVFTFVVGWLRGHAAALKEWNRPADHPD